MQNEPGTLRASLLTDDHLLQVTSSRLQQTEQMCAESEAMGASILGELRGQREQLTSARDTLSGAQQDLAAGQTTIRRMLARTLADRLILAFIVVMLLALIGLILWYEFAGKRH
ncbi:hypothetical protein KFE25_001433 [Diacronema lutheri]|uniref:t-SNARE coiled-coil homology domain-containing protein n=1 Tax=Diacronema lutheri TaxID=2081491 RepID=A0A8J5XMK9_DIALT|nr:hypothetical protein KFE25_001433 [Diacronema lutheri]